MKFATHFDPNNGPYLGYQATLDLVEADEVEFKNFMNAFKDRQATTITFKVITYQDSSIWYSIWSNATLRVGLHTKVVEDQQEQVLVPYFSMEVSSEKGLPRLDKYKLYEFFKEIAGPVNVMAETELKLEPILIQIENQTLWEKEPPGLFSGYRPKLDGQNVFEKLCRILFDPRDVQVKMYTDPEKQEYGLDLCFRFNGIQSYCDWN